MVNFRLYCKVIFRPKENVRSTFSLGLKMTLQQSRKFTIPTISLVCNLYHGFFKMSLLFGFCLVLEQQILLTFFVSVLKKELEQSRNNVKRGFKFILFNYFKATFPLSFRDETCIVLAYEFMNGVNISRCLHEQRKVSKNENIAVRAHNFVAAFLN